MLNNIKEAIEAISEGKIIIVVDDENRENEGDFICAAEYVTPEIVNFMATHGRGLICASITEERCEELQLDLMVGKNTASFDTPFTVSVDLLGHGCSTGISASDRAKTIRALVDPETKPEELGKPGHIFPLKAKGGGVLRRAGHTEAAIDFPRLAGLRPAGVLVEIMNEDGSMARLPDLRKVADRFQLKLVSIQDLIEYRLAHESLIMKEFTLPLNTIYGSFILHVYRQNNAEDLHLALVKGKWDEDEAVLTRVHASNVFEDIFGAVTAESSISVLHASMQIVEKEGKGIILYMNQETMGSGLFNRIRQYQEQISADVNANNSKLLIGSKMDQRDYGIGAQILRDLGARKLKLITNHPTKRVGIHGYGLEIVDYVSVDINNSNK